MYNQSRRGSEIELESHEPTANSYLIARCLTKWLTGSPLPPRRVPCGSKQPNSVTSYHHLHSSIETEILGVKQVRKSPPALRWNQRSMAG